MGIPKDKRKNMRSTGREDDLENTAIDPETGERYHIIPKQENFSPQGYTPLHLTDLDLNDLEEGAKKYLPGRLRKAPDREEIRRLLNERKAMELKREQEWQEESVQIDEQQKKAREKRMKKFDIDKK